MRPHYLSRAADRTKGTLLRVLMLTGLAVALAVSVGLAQGQTLNPRPAISVGAEVPAVNEQPVQPSEIGVLFKRWEQTERRRFGRDLLPAVAELTVRARIRGVTTLEAYPLLMVVAADVTHHVAGARNCAAGADSYARLLQTGQEAFLAGNAKVRETVDRLGQAYAECREAREEIAQVAGSGKAGIFITGVVDAPRSAELGAERERRAIADLQAAAMRISEPVPPSLSQPAATLHQIEDAVTGWVVTLGGDTMARLLADAPWLDPDSKHFKRGLWWSLLASLWLCGSVLHRLAVQAVTRAMTSARPSTEVRTTRTGAITARETTKRKSSVVRRH